MNQITDFSKVDSDRVDPSVPSDDSIIETKCNLIYHVLHALLLRQHNYIKFKRLGSAGIHRPPSTADTSSPPLLLQPIIDMLQYQVFCERVKSEADTMVGALTEAGVPSTLRFNPVGEIGKELVGFLTESQQRPIGGDAILRADDRSVYAGLFGSHTDLGVKTYNPPVISIAFYPDGPSCASHVEHIVYSTIMPASPRRD